MARLRQQDAASQKLQAAMEAEKQLPPITERVAKNGIEAVTNSELRKSMLATRSSNARKGMEACMREMGATVNRFFTPEERVEFARSLEARNAAMARADAYDFLLPAAEKAGIPELQVRLMYEATLARPYLATYTQKLEDLQIRRLRLKELGQQLEQLAEVRIPDHPYSGGGYLSRAQEIYNLAGSQDDEFRVLSTERKTSQQQNRYYELLLARNPQRLIQLANNSKELADAKTNFVVSHGDAKLALDAIDARSASVT